MAIGPKLVPAGSLTEQDVTQLNELGSIRYDEQGNEFRYVKAQSAISKGNVCGPVFSASASRWTVTPTVALSPGKFPAGVGLYSISGGAYGYVQKTGVNYYTNSKSAVTAGLFLTWRSNLVATQLAAGHEHLSFGLAMATDSGSVIPRVRLWCN